MLPLRRQTAPALAATTPSGAERALRRASADARPPCASAGILRPAPAQCVRRVTQGDGAGGLPAEVISQAQAQCVEDWRAFGAGLLAPCACSAPWRPAPCRALPPPGPLPCMTSVHALVASSHRVVRGAPVARTPSAGTGPGPYALAPRRQQGAPSCNRWKTPARPWRVAWTRQARARTSSVLRHLLIPRTDSCERLAASVRREPPLNCTHGCGHGMLIALASLRLPPFALPRLCDFLRFDGSVCACISPQVGHRKEDEGAWNSWPAQVGAGQPGSGRVQALPGACVSCCGRGMRVVAAAPHVM